MPRRGALPVRRRLLRREGARPGPARPTSSSPTTPCWPSTRSPTPRAARARPAGRRRGARAGRPGHRRGHRRAVGGAARRGARGGSARLVEPGARASGSRRRRRRSPRRSTTRNRAASTILDDELATYLTALRDAADSARAGDRHRRPATPRPPRRATRRSTALTDVSDTADADPDVVRSGASPTAPTWCGWTTRTIRRQTAPIGSRPAGGAAVGGGAAAQRLFDAVDGRAHLGDADRRRHRSTRWPRSWGLTPAPRRAPTWRGHRRRIAVRTTPSRASSTSPRTCRRPGRDGAGSDRAARRDRRPDHRGGRPHAGPVLVDARGQGGRRGDARAPRHPGAVPGRRHHRGAGRAVRRRRRRRRCSARCRCGRASTCPGRRCRWC